MRTGISIKYRPWLYAVSWTLSISSLLLAFFALPIPLSVLLGVVFFLFPIWLDRQVFHADVLWAHPGSVVFSRRIATCWYADESNEQELLGLGIVFEKRGDAQEAYQLLRTWNCGAYVDREQNIKVTVVQETKFRFSVFVYPGTRTQRKAEIETAVQESLPRDVEAHVTREFKIWIRNCVDYEDRPELLKALELLKQHKSLLLNTFFVKNSQVTAYAKRSLRLEKIAFLSRSDLTESSLEYHHEWTDPREERPEVPERVKAILQAYSG